MDPVARLGVLRDRCEIAEGTYTFSQSPGARPLPDEPSLLQLCG